MPGLGARFTIFAFALVTSAVAQEPTKLTMIGSSSPGFAVAEEKIFDSDGKGRDRLVILGRRGEVRTLDPDTGKFVGDLDLPHPERSLVAIARLHGEGPATLVVFAPDGLRGYRWREGAFRQPSRRLLRRGRFAMRLGAPTFANIAQDVNGDGRPDLVLPDHTSCTLYLNREAKAADAGDNGETEPPPRFERASQLQLRVTSESSTRNDRLSRELRHSIQIPDLRTLDVNGDGRFDLVATVDRFRHYHLQREDGAFPDRPDATLDLSKFRDTTPKAEIDFGRTLTVDEAILNSRDLDGDGIPDYVIAHRRKVWVYHGTRQGPQFTEPSKILILADDVTFLLLLHLDDDAWPDLLAFKLQVPTIATLFLGLFSEWDVTIRSVGYANEGGRSFAKKPKWRTETTLRAPSLMSLISNPEDIIERFSEVGRRFRHSVSGDLNGDDKTDILLQTEDHKALQFWLMPTPREDEKRLADREIRKLLFEQTDTVWDVDRIVELLQTMANSRTARLTRGRVATGQIALRDPESFRLEFAAAADFDGDGRDEVVLHYTRLVSPFDSTFDLLRLRP